MPLYNPLTGNKRRRPIFETAQNKRSLGLDATDRMLIRRDEIERDEVCKALFVTVSTHVLEMLDITKNLIRRGIGKSFTNQTIKSLMQYCYTHNVYLQRDEPIVFVIGNGNVIKGWERGLIGMCIGEIRKLIVPSDMAYGNEGSAMQIPPNATLVYEIELHEY